MRKNIFSTSVLMFVCLFFITGIQAAQLNGLWRNERQNITIRIEENENGFRAKRIDQGIWYRYVKQDNYAYVDRNGNWYKIVDRDELEWNEVSTKKRLIFHRVDSRSNDPEIEHERMDHPDSPRSRTGDRDIRKDHQQTPLEGRWYDRSSKERIEIVATHDGYRVRTEHGSWEKYAGDRTGTRLRSGSGNTIRLIDRNTIQMRNALDRKERTFIRQGNGNMKAKYKDHKKENKDKGHKDHKDHKDHKNNDRVKDHHKDHHGKRRG